jgi:hypothetical protein
MIVEHTLKNGMLARLDILNDCLSWCIDIPDLGVSGLPTYEDDIG